jgi:hypothetical protein
VLDSTIGRQMRTLAAMPEGLAAFADSMFTQIARFVGIKVSFSWQSRPLGFTITSAPCHMSPCWGPCASSVGVQQPSQRYVR